MVPSVAELDRIPERVIRLLRLSIYGGAAFAAYKIQWRTVLKDFFTGPGRISRILMLIFALFNFKNLPGMWTIRLWHAILYHCFMRKAPRLGPRSLFRPLISESHAPLTEIDYNIHKSNSTYFSDLDIARSHMASHLLRPGFRKLTHNTKTGVIIDDITGKPRRGNFGIMLGAVHCSFRREITAYAPYEMWTRILAWDRKWLYMVTHFVPKGIARPSEYLDTKFGPRAHAQGPSRQQRSQCGDNTPSYIIGQQQATAAHPRAGGLRATHGVGDEEDLGEVANDGSWDWKMVENRRREGMVFAQQFANLDTLESWFDGGDGGDGSALGRFGLSAASW
ncbi:conserved hypothetical protein [Verticillium alfalfae VaMs.102]|uniref:Capsule polysaccharide biosynthesis protein n=1 Tax=Verticillium alfalfae (strain VaMs.102 / ATCC MYA-4576 / FGSC 10136) TaxID=526221 RepID=C9S9F4_VERA1|nr:conserved hypothetical protein [Verticillium alfalfae VaMs.102]EEY16017.1 conserved hypothetical protein [Verticillium alfalfae VaMs.102]